MGVNKYILNKHVGVAAVVEVTTDVTDRFGIHDINIFFSTILFPCGDKSKAENMSDLKYLLVTLLYWRFLWFGLLRSGDADCGRKSPSSSCVSKVCVTSILCMKISCIIKFKLQQHTSESPAPSTWSILFLLVVRLFPSSCACLRL